MQKHPNSEMAKFAEYCLKTLQRTKKRDYIPSRNEVIACYVSTQYAYVGLLVSNNRGLSLARKVC